MEFCLHRKHLQTIKNLVEQNKIKIKVKYQEAIAIPYYSFFIVYKHYLNIISDK